MVAVPGAGVAVLEVKGGHVRHDGQGWRQSGGGAQDKAIDPVGQARRCTFALRTYVNDDAWWRRRRVRFAHLVAFRALQQQEHDNPLATVADVDDLLDILTGRPASQREPVDLAAARDTEIELLPARERPAHVGEFHALGVEWGTPRSSRG